MFPGGERQQILTIIIIVDSHVSWSCVHDLVSVCRESFLVTRWQRAAFFLELSNQLRKKDVKKHKSYADVLSSVIERTVKRCRADNEGSGSPYLRLWPQVLPKHQTDTVTTVWTRGKRPAGVQKNELNK